MNYDAFISYSHAMDMPFGSSIQIGLQRLGKPWYKLRQLNIFRDETDLSASPGLWQRIEESLVKSEYFILLASPEAASSKWVLKEVAFWLQYKDVNRLIIVLTSGTIEWDEINDFDWEKTTSLPQSLSKRFPGLPLYIEFTQLRGSTDLSLNNPQFKTNIAKISSVIQGISVKELIDKDVQEHRKTIRLRNSIITVMCLFLVGLSIALITIVHQRNEAQRVAAANQQVVYALNKTSVTQSLFHAYNAYELNPSPYTANLLTSFGEDPVVFYDLLEVKDSSYLSQTVWSKGRLYTGHDKGIVQCISEEKIVTARIQLPLQVVSGMQILEDNLLVVYGHSDSANKYLLYFLEENTLKIRATVSVASYINSVYVNEKKELVTGDGDGCIRTYTHDGRLCNTVQLKGIHDPIEGLAQDKTGRYLTLTSYTGSLDSVIRQFDSMGVETGHFDTQAKKQLKKMAFFAKTGMLVAVDEKGNSYIWDKPGLPLQRSSVVEDGLLPPNSILSLGGCSFTPSGNAYAILMNGSCIVRDLNGKIKAVASTLFGSINCVSFLNEETFLTSGVKEPFLFFWNSRGYMIESKELATKEPILWSEQSSDYCLKRGDSLFLQQLSGPALAITLKSPFTAINYFACDTSHIFFLANSEKGCLLDKRTGKIKKEFSYPKGNKILLADFAHRKLYLDTKKGYVKVFDWEQMTTDSIQLPKEDEIMFLKAHRNGTILIGGGTVSKSAFLLVYNQNNKLMWSFRGLTEVVNDGLLSLDGTKVTVVDDGGKLKQWNIRSGRQLIDVQVGVGISMGVKTTIDEKYFLVNDMISNAVHLLDAHGYSLQTISFENSPTLINFISDEEFCVRTDNRLLKMFTIKGFMESDRFAKKEMIEKLEQNIQPFVVDRLIRKTVMPGKHME